MRWASAVPSDGLPAASIERALSLAADRAAFG